MTDAPAASDDPARMGSDRPLPSPQDPDRPR